MESVAKELKGCSAVTKASEVARKNGVPDDDDYWEVTITMKKGLHKRLAKSTYTSAHRVQTLPIDGCFRCRRIGHVSEKEICCKLL
jgi:hypothetical protein